MFTANSTKATFYVNLKEEAFDTAELACQARGGHLATFTTLKEQQEVRLAASPHTGWHGCSAWNRKGCTPPAS